MVDKALFIDSNSESGSLHQLEILSNNLANIGTVGFRADHEVYKSVPVSTSNENDTRIYSTLDKTFSSFDLGPVATTGRDLDVAIAGQGFIAVQTKAGQEAYTRAGDLQIKNNFLTTRTGELIKGSSGVVNVPAQAQRIMISPDGIVSVKLADQLELVNIDKIKLTNPSTAKLHKGTDGLFYLEEGESAKPDNSIRLTPGALEGSNVNAVQTLTDLIDLSRRFEFHSNLMKNFSDSASKANQLLNLS